MNPTDKQIADAAMEFYRAKLPAADEARRRERCLLAKQRLYALLDQRLRAEGS